ncbi:hypothetical protein A0H81_13971 [Grifola frondosa]|uniref:Uncharacterized protein n=1 Tax=Grifola frondosa TaxID=5627 RepID=A0A1C7LMW3_GRIFR|nr:hypothetical protein A0H81_13971 [Grifola frondosa]
MILQASPPHNVLVLEARGHHSDLTADDLDELRKIGQSLTRADARWYYMIHDYQRRSTPVHMDITCENCDETIHGGRVVYLECDGRMSVDFCDKPTCMSAEIHKDQRDDLESPHLPTHDVFKLRMNILQSREYGQNYRAARDALKKAKAAFEDSAEMEGEQAGTDGEDVEPSYEEVARRKNRKPHQ